MKVKWKMYFSLDVTKSLSSALKLTFIINVVSRNKLLPKPYLKRKKSLDLLH